MNMLIIDFNDETNEITKQNQELVEDLLNFASKKFEIQDGSEISVTFVTNEKIQEINRDYRGKDQPTDVISFAMEELGEDELAIQGIEMPRVLGDIIISVPKTKEQAAEFGHSFERELGFLAVHSLLHLLGYDHMTEEEEKEMFGLQREILDEYGLKR
ncbi:rRNA maturation RNase YbeY [Heyndrickxia sporothermodurans]|uniref:Endoribonuclease YbeY n=2 Tax=Bacillaceae TaxID=186817 RepID=A0AB37H5V7_9BACI|nr:rRNA maturation RNase YbeY [Heyndrickxia sporothermodurans]MBL5767449.1 rRNA maturation RNase YbeY [Heyndrickxia sporothermodurans]MBL5770885.1 rRNA maturation RNase YbeY [Heyndrickxia sporothermodurans]MBL5776311.1 rRNA maturation RNase YbeY [Heyndrickxia sporothermodurans]MBL5778042.1 rRNA maturation RNase YbeY [Heyndrickxia sporothermodurans]MBL5781683.1 rRNA maturation RNase YbeY [Heyndrickxia sporothermodurans]